MIAGFAWSNLQIVNVTNAVVNLYSDDRADLFVLMGPHISADLIDSIRQLEITTS